MKLSILLCLCLLAQGVFPHMPTVYEFCSHVVANGEGGRATCDASQCHGRPGKVGPVGLRGIQGLKGQKGENGTSEVRILEGKTGPVGRKGIQGLKGQKGEKGTSGGLEEKVRILEESLKRMETVMSDTVCYMGMKSGLIPDSAITSSSDHSANHAAHRGRLDNQVSRSNNAMWCAPANNPVGDWIQVDLRHPEVVAGVITQGKNGHWVTAYKVSCGITDGNMATITEHGRDKVFSANTDDNTKVVNKFPQLMTCRYIRIYPQRSHYSMCMRLEIIRGSCKDIY